MSHTDLERSAQTWLMRTGVMGALGVIAGAFGAHGLKSHLSPEFFQIWETAVYYHLFHVPALMGVALTCQVLGPRKWVRLSGWFFLFGTVVFSGSLYLLALTNIRFLGAITPFGGMALILGWFSIAVGSLRERSRHE